MEKKQIITKMKKIKIVLGNGFDLYCGLQTKYINYFENEMSGMGNVIKWVDEFRKHKKYHIEALNETLNSLFSYNYPNNLNPKNTIWDVFFYMKSLKSIENIKWCDLESEMRDSLTKEYDLFRKNFWCFIHEKVNDYYKHNILIVDKEIELICVAYFVGIKNCGEKTKKEFFAMLLEELKTFEKNFGEYIKKQCKNDNYETDFIRTIKKLICKDDLGNVSSIDTFNYSFISNKKINLYNINNNYKNPIFGIDSTSISSFELSYIFTKTYRRLESKFSKPTVNDDFSFENLIVFGHSLNEQDYNYFFPLFDNMDLMDKSSTGKVVFACSIYDKDKEQEIARELIINASRMIEKYEKYKRLNNECRLLDMLKFKERILFYVI